MEKQQPYILLWRAWREQGDREAQRQLVEIYLPLVDKLCSRFFLNAHMEREDFRSIGVLGLLDSIEKYDYEGTVQFETYATWRIRGSVLDELRREDRVSRKVREKAKRIEAAFAKLEQEQMRSVEDAEVCRYLNMEMSEFTQVLLEVSASTYLSLEEGFEDEPKELADLQAMGPEERVDQLFLQQAVGEGLKRLPEKERLVLSLFYYEDLKPQEIAQVMGLSVSRISQLHSKAIFRLRGMLGRKKKELYS